MDLNHPSLKQMADEAEKWCARYFQNRTERTLLVLAGVPGTGKSRCARAVFQWMGRIGVSAYESNKAWRRAPMASFLYWPEVADEVRAKDFRSIQEALDADGLILDDIGADDDPFRQAEDKLCQILSRRERKFTLLTTNIEPKDWASKFEARVGDRFMRNSVVVNLEGVPSYTLST